MGVDRITCGKCNRKCVGQALSVGETYFHHHCFTCQGCGSELGEDAFYNKEGAFYCAKDYLERFGEHCFKCNQFLEGDVITALGNTFHLDCFTCGHCKKFFPPGENVVFDGQDYMCEVCDASGDPSQLPLHKCAGCREDIKTGQALMALEQHWHPKCFTCRKCGIVLQGEYMGKDGYAFCEKDYQAEFGVICASCQGYITGKVLQAGDKHYHPQCSRCAKCGQMFGEGEEMYLQGSEIWHPQCSEMVREMERVEKERAEAERREMDEGEAQRREMERRELDRRDGEQRERERVEGENREAEQREQDRKERERREIEAERREAERREIEQREIERKDMERRDLERRDLERRDVERRDGERRDGERRDGERRDGERRDVERRDVERREAEERELEHREAERRDAERRDGERRDAEQRDGERRDGERKDAERKDAEQRDAEQRDGEQRDGERRDAERRDAERRDAERRDAERRDGEQRDAERRDAERRDMDRNDGYYRGKVNVDVNSNTDGPIINHADLPPPNFSPPGRVSPQFADLPPPPRPEEMPKGPPAPPTRTASRGKDWKARYGSLPRNTSGSENTDNVETRDAPVRPRPYSYHEPSYNNYEENTTTAVTQDQKYKTSVQLKMSKSTDDSIIGRTRKTSSSSSLSSPNKEYKMIPYKDIRVDNYRMPRGVDKANLEKYLNDEDFREVFKMAKDEFYELPKWKQHDQKKKVKLF